MHDTKTKSLVPLAEFVSTVHNSIWISKNLFSIKAIMIQNIQEKNKYAIAPLVVTDMGWALINALHQSFNNCTITQYLKWTFDLVTLKNRTTDLHAMMRIRTYICSTHFLKIIIKHAKLELKNFKKDASENVLRTFIFSFSILQNSVGFEEFEENFKDIYQIFNQATQNDLFLNALARIKSKLAKRDDDKFFTEIFYDKVDKEKIPFSSENTIYSVDNSKNLKENSPYSKYFIQVLNSVASKPPKLRSKIENAFFQPTLFEIILDYIHLASLWSGLVIGNWQIFVNKEIRFTRLTNNPVEDYFNHLKNHLIPKNCMPSQFTCAIYEMLQMKYLLLYYIDENLKTKPPKLPEKIETWQKKQIFRRQKGFYYKNFPNFGKFNFDFSNDGNILDVTSNFDSKTITQG